MPKQFRTIAYIVIVLALLCLGGCLVSRVQPAYVKWKLKRQIQRIEPWTATTNYSAEGWKQLVRAARVVQQADPPIATAVFREYLQGYAGKPGQLTSEQGKVFLLLRIVFDLGEHAPPGQRIFAGWTRGRSDVNDDGTVNLAWPVSLDQGKPRLVAGCEGAAGDTYSVADEFTYLRYKFKYRDLSTIRLDN